jgi:hypothetical protein
LIKNRGLVVVQQLGELLILDIGKSQNSKFKSPARQIPLVILNNKRNISYSAKDEIHR